ncbi:hypothetical protein ABMA27_013381 [Loxostege sticticalis]|uniref:Integrase catalytic domain-containing protein n=1 Tax=Loxostege sticticalis TaxID=481309 RepID=A0ABR3IF16_LOXSC
MAVNITTDQFQKLLETISSSRRSTLASCTASFNGEKNSEAVESFLAAVNVYKEIEKITDSEALAGLPLLLRQEAGKWWQGIKTNVTKWDDFQTRLRDTFAPKKPACLIYHEITSERQRPNEPMESFISKKRMLFSLLAENCAKALIDEIFLRYGMPRRVTSDNGPQFVSAVMQQVTFCLQIKHSFTPVYHPEANPKPTSVPTKNDLNPIRRGRGRPKKQTTS